MFKLLSKNSYWIILGFLLLLNFSPVLAADPAYEDCGKDFCLNVPIGADTAGFDMGSNILGNYVRAWYGFLLGTVGIMATVMIMWGGFKYLTSRGDKSQITTAKAQIISALTGVVLAFSSYTLLSIINPALLVITMPNLPDIKGGENVALSQEAINTGVGNGDTTSGNSGQTGGPPGSTSGLQPQTLQMISDIQSLCPEAAITPHGGFRPSDRGSNHANGTAGDFYRGSCDGVFQDLINQYKLGPATWKYDSRDGNNNGYDLNNVTINGHTYPVVRIIDERTCWHIDFDPTTRANFR